MTNKIHSPALDLEAYVTKIVYDLLTRELTPQALVPLIKQATKEALDEMHAELVKEKPEQ